MNSEIEGVAVKSQLRFRCVKTNCLSPMKEKSIIILLLPYCLLLTELCFLTLTDTVIIHADKRHKVVPGSLIVVNMHVDLI